MLFLAPHYPLAAALRQKVGALAGRSVVQARDVFDLGVLFAKSAGKVDALQSIHSRRRSSGRWASGSIRRRGRRWRFRNSQIPRHPGFIVGTGRAYSSRRASNASWRPRLPTARYWPASCTACAPDANGSLREGGTQGLVPSSPRWGRVKKVASRMTPTLAGNRSQGRSVGKSVSAVPGAPKCARRKSASKPVRPALDGYSQRLSS